MSELKYNGKLKHPDYVNVSTKENIYEGLSVEARANSVSPDVREFIASQAIKSTKYTTKEKFVSNFSSAFLSYMDSKANRNEYHVIDIAIEMTNFAEIYYTTLEANF